MIKTKLCELLNIEFPIFQGGMAWIADSSLAAAVSNAGGLGIIAAGSAPADIVRNEIRRAKELTDKPFGVNIMLMSPHAEEIAKIVCEEKVAVVTTGAGNPGKYIDMWKEAGIKVIPVVPSVALAKRMERSGADAVIAEGHESGGHIGEITTMSLVPQVVDAVSIPVVAAGGIADGRGFLAALSLGAVGVQMGTRFLVAKECNVHQNYKQRVISAKDIDSVITGVSTGHPVRSLRNKFTRELITLEKQGIDPDIFEQKAVGSLKRAAVDGDVDFGSVMAGQISGLVKCEQSAQEIIKEIIDEATAFYKNLGQVIK